MGWYIDCFSILAFTFVGEGYARAAEVMITGKGSPHQIKLIHASFVRRVALPFPPYPRFYYPLLNSSLPIMSHTTPTSSNFQLIFDNALKGYKRCTKEDILTHPLADQLEACDSASSILTLLQDQVEVLNQSQGRNLRWTRWLDPTVKVLHAFSEIGKGVTLVCLSS